MKELSAGIDVGSEQHHVIIMNDKEHTPQKFKNLLALIIDERSLVDSTLLGKAGMNIAETICGGRANRLEWGSTTT